MNRLDDFRLNFSDAFSLPELKSTHYDDLFGELEITSEYLAGPMHSIFKRGNCKYVFNSTNTAFKDITNPDDLLTWFQSLVKEYRDLILSVEPHTAYEVLDRDHLLLKAEKME